MQKFKIGDKVQCIPKPCPTQTTGAGYRPNIKFTINEITEPMDNKVYWGAPNGGCYAYDIQKIKHKTQTLNNLASIKKALKL